jgi:hypothetical protein
MTNSAYKSQKQIFYTKSKKMVKSDQTGIITLREKKKLDYDCFRKKNSFLKYTFQKYQI